jgi:hypothetical protein
MMYTHHQVVNTLHKEMNQTEYLEDLTYPDLAQIDPDVQIYSVLKAMCLKDGIEYYSERINMGGLNGILNTNNRDKTYTLSGFDLDSEDPRLFLYHNEIYMLFNIRNPRVTGGRLMCLSRYDRFHPVQLRIENRTLCYIEKNWSPLIKNDQLYLIYTYEPLVVLKYDFNEKGVCQVIYDQTLLTPTPAPTPASMSPFSHLRGGSNLLPFNEDRDLYIGLCHSRIETDQINIGGYVYCYYLPHLVLIDTRDWKLLYVSPILIFNRNDQPVIHESPWMCTVTPTSLNFDPCNGDYLLTINVNETITYKYSIKPEITPVEGTGQWDSFVREMAIDYVKKITTKTINKFI